MEIVWRLCGGRRISARYTNSRSGIYDCQTLLLSNIEVRGIERVAVVVEVAAFEGEYRLHGSVTSHW